jgi:(R,R)-butanediol dehydrogenase/meso-butanediol dehydrogenase/diacetyl reductase
MRAAVFHEPGAPLAIEHVDDPSPAAGQVVIAVKRCGICGTDLHATEEHDGLLVPGTVMGHEFAGEIVEVGTQCPSDWKPGRKVTGLPSLSCGHCLPCQTGKPLQCESNIIVGLQRSGGFAEYLALDTHNSILLPDSVDWVEGALIEPLAVGLHAVNMSANIRGKRVLILGAGPVGLAVSFWSRFMGAYHITVTEPETIRRESTMQFGADVGLASGAPEAVLPEIIKAAGGMPDVIFECVGVPGMLAEAITYSRYGGEVVVVGFCARPDTLVPAAAVMKELSVRFVVAYDKADFDMIAGLMARDKLDVTHMCTDTVGFDAFSQAFESLRTPNAHCKIMLDPGAT